MMIQFTCLVSLILLLQAVDSAPAALKQNLLDLKATSCNINIQTGPSKKLEDVVLQMKRQLDEIQKELRNLTRKEEYNTTGNWFCRYFFSHFLVMEIVRLKLQ